MLTWAMPRSRSRASLSMGSDHSPRSGAPLAACAAILVALLPPGPALAWLLCVAPDGETSGDCSDGYYPDFASALSAAYLLPLAGPGEDVEIRLLGDPDGPPHYESISADTRGSVLDEVLPEVHLNFRDRLLCPGPGSPQGEPVFSLSTGAWVIVESLAIDLGPDGPCPSERPGAQFQGGGWIHFSSADLAGWTGWGVSAAITGDTTALWFENSSIRNGLGPALRSSHTLGLVLSEIVGNRLPPDSGTPAIVHLAPLVGTLDLRDTVLFGNLVEDGPGERALVAGEVTRLRNTAVIANGLAGDDVAAFRLGFLGWAHEPGEDISIDEFRALLDSVIARNRHIVLPDDFELPTWPMSEFVQTPWSDDVPRCLGEPDTSPFHLRPSPFADLPLGSGPLIVVDPEGGYPPAGGLVMARNFIVENESSGSALIDARLAPGLSLQLMHDTLAGNRAGSLVRVAGGGPGSELVAVRNLLVDGEDGPRPIEIDAGVERVFVSMNASAGRPWSEGVAATGHSIVGPDILVGDLAFADTDAFRALSACERHALLCPGTGAGDCDAWAGEAGALQCAPDAAAEWLPDPATAQQIEWEWPWDTGFLPRGIPAADVAGATGWLCATARGTLDKPSSATEWGDADGYPDAFDCDNEDPSVVPALPAKDGVSTRWCDPAGGSCWVCPEGTEMQDDDSGDDDSGDVDDDSQGDDDSDASREAWGACTGCGLPWTCEDGLLVLALAPLVLLPRRARPPGRSPRSRGLAGHAAPRRLHLSSSAASSSRSARSRA